LPGRSTCWVVGFEVPIRSAAALTGTQDRDLHNSAHPTSNKAAHVACAQLEGLRTQNGDVPDPTGTVSGLGFSASRDGIPGQRFARRDAGSALRTTGTQVLPGAHTDLADAATAAGRAAGFDL
jgi:hypothetical protein